MASSRPLKTSLLVAFPANTASAYLMQGVGFYILRVVVSNVEVVVSRMRVTHRLLDDTPQTSNLRIEAN